MPIRKASSLLFIAAVLLLSQACDARPDLSENLLVTPIRKTAASPAGQTPSPVPTLAITATPRPQPGQIDTSRDTARFWDGEMWVPLPANLRHEQTSIAQTADGVWQLAVRGESYRYVDGIWLPSELLSVAPSAREIVGKVALDQAGHAVAYQDTLRGWQALATALPADVLDIDQEMVLLDLERLGLTAGQQPMVNAADLTSLFNASNGQWLLLGREGIPILAQLEDGGWLAVGKTWLQSDGSVLTWDPSGSVYRPLGEVRAMGSEGYEVLIDGSWVAAPLHNFNPHNLAVREASVWYESGGLVLRYESDRGKWRVPPIDQVPFDDGAMTGIYLARGDLLLNTDAAARRMREFFIAWIQSTGNEPYRVAKLGRAFTTDAEVETLLSADDIDITSDLLRVPYIKRGGVAFGRPQQFMKIAVPDVNTISTDSMGVIVVYEEDWRQDLYGIAARIGELTKLSGNLDAGYNESRLYLDRAGRLIFVHINRGAAERHPWLQEHHLVGGFDSTHRNSDALAATQVFETVINVLRRWRYGHLEQRWLYHYGFTPELFNQAYPETPADGSYGAFPDQIRRIYGEDTFLFRTP